jgi:CDP-diacylglycerol--serine O-phosphatidyltransferase
MSRLRRKATKERLLRRVPRQRVKHITVLPSLVTILNGVCGFTAIVFASKGMKAGIGQVSHFTMACYMILAAMIADMLDGRLARISKNTSSFGGQLDSLCDIISFGVAPAFLMVKLLEHKLAGFAEINPTSGSFLQRFIWVAAAAYVSCAAIRLARFNVENEEDESAHMSFIGLPSPAAAGVLVSLVIFQQHTLPELFTSNPQAYRVCENAIVYALPFLSLGTGILMVSRLRYPHVLNQYFKGKKPFAHLIWALLLLAVIVWSRLAALVPIFCGFAASSFVKWLYDRVIRRKGIIPVGQDQQAALIDSSEAQVHE